MGVATAVAIGGLAITAGTTAMSFAQASEQKKKQREAEAKAAEAMAIARNKLGINYALERSIQKEPFELQREALLSQGALALQAGQESDRGAEATAGRVQLAQNEAQAGVRGAMGEYLTDIEKDIINEDSRLRDIGVQLDLEEAGGQQLISRDAEEAAALATSQGIEGAVSTLQQGLGLIPLYMGNKNTNQKNALGKTELTSEQFQSIGNVTGKKGAASKSMGAASTTPGATNLDLEKVKNMTSKEFRQFKRELTPQQRKKLFGSQQFMEQYNPFYLNED